MKQVKVLMVFSVIVVALCSSELTNAAAQVGPQVKLWAAIGVAQPVFQLPEMEKMAMSFVVVNDGETVADPSVEASHLFINGVEPKDWSFVISNGLRNSYFKALPPGQILSFGYQLGPSYFSTPGIYSVRWEGPNYKSAEVTFRVMPGGR
jgi:hypothetical protein